MYDRIKKYIQQYKMLSEGDAVVVGISGGADSVCLMHILARLRDEYHLHLVGVHVHHGLRGETAERDAKFSEEFCKRFEIPFYLYREDVDAYAKRQGLTVEEAGRNVRRRIFEEVAHRWICDERESTDDKASVKIALAHHENDNAETLVWNLCRGTGLRGMGGISPKDGKYIRPLLCVNRQEIEVYLRRNNLSHCTDETNEEDHYTRNKIRHHVIPYFERELNGQAVSHMSELAGQMHILGDYVDRQVQKELDVCRMWNGNNDSAKSCILLMNQFDKADEALKPYILKKIICEVTGRRKDITAKHIEIIENLMRLQVGRKVHLPYGLEVRRIYEGLEFIPLTTKDTAQNEFLLEANGDIEKLFSSRVFARESGPVLFPKSVYTKWFDYAIISNAVTIRHRTTGDYITINKDGRTQPLKQYFINEKIPADQRDKIWLVADGHHILWIVGYRQNQYYQISEKTSRVLEITFHGGEDNGRES